MSRKLVYIAAPHSGNGTHFTDDIKGNIEFAKRAARFAINKGVMPFVPHLMYPILLEDNTPEEHALRIEFNHAMLTKCDELWYFTGHGISDGMHQTFEFAKAHGIPVVDIPLKV